MHSKTDGGNDVNNSPKKPLGINDALRQRIRWSAHEKRARARRALAAPPRWVRTLVRFSLGAALGVGSGCGAKTGLTVPCSVDVETTKPEVVIVLDRSDSMRELTREGISLMDVVKRSSASVIPQFEGAGDLGLLIFPEESQTSCSAPRALQVPVGQRTTGAIVEEIRRTTLIGRTPTNDALTVAGATLREHARAAPTRRRFIVLVTDGGATCNESIALSACRCTNIQTSCEAPGGLVLCLDDVRTIDTVRNLRHDGIETIVIGLAPENPTSLFAEFLQGVSAAGGAADRFGTPYLSARVSAQFEAVFTRVLLEESYCSLVVRSDGSRPPDFLLSRGRREPRGVFSGSGWDIDQANPQRVRLVGAVCDAAIRERITSWEGGFNQRCSMRQ